MGETAAGSKRRPVCSARCTCPWFQQPVHPDPNPALLGHDRTGHWAGTSQVREQLFLGSLLLSPWSWCTQGSVCALQESVSPVLCKFWWLYGGVNGDLLQEGLCHTQGCCTQSPCPCGRPLLTHLSTGDIQTLKDRSGSVSVESPGAYKVFFEPSKHVWWVWGLI